MDGHTESVLVKFKKPAANVAQVESVLGSYTSAVQSMHLPSAPEVCIQILTQNNRPQPRLDRDRGNGFTVSVGRVRPLKTILESNGDAPLLGVQFTLLSHNTILGAAGSAILNAELAVAKGLVRL